MIVYHSDKANFLDDAFKRDIEDVILAEFTLRTGRRVGRSEIRSWKESLLAIAKALNDDDIPDDSGVAIEYNIPQTGKRIDFMLSGANEHKQDHLIIVELKQWSTAKKTDKDAIVAVQMRGGSSEENHPSYQAWSYASLLENFNEAVFDGGIRLLPCAYLHNYAADGMIDGEFYSPHTDRAPVFLKGEDEKKKLQEFIKQYVKFGDKADLIYRMEHSRIRPSKGLVDSLAGMLKGNDEFVLIDDQKVVFENALSMARKIPKEPKQVLIVEGGPGTGKSVVAINLLVSLTKMDLVARYVTKNSAPRVVFEKKLTGSLRRTVISNMFSGSGAFTDGAQDVFDVLVVDEAHRLNEKSGLYGNLGENQIKELVEASRFSIFFLDEDQRVTFKDIGRKSEIIRWAKASGASVTEMELASQFRCNGSSGYLAWLDNTLGIRETANRTLDGREFDFRVFDSPEVLRRTIVERNKVGNKARMVAGYCWDWNSKRNAGAADVVIPEFSFAMQWNLSEDGGLWIIAPDSVKQIGCIHTCQGLEVDYVGVIVGPDLIVRDGEVLTLPERRSKRDKSLSGYKKLSLIDKEAARARADTIIKNTYRTLMTRGMKGCYVYFTDKETAGYFKSRLVQSNSGLKGEVANIAEREGCNNVLPFERVKQRDLKPYANAVPLIDLKFAAGVFGGTQINAESVSTWVSLPDMYNPKPDLFVAQVVGESMNRRIPNGAWCLFRLNPAGTRQGKVVVAQHRQISDPDLGGSYTIKVYQSEKRRSAAGDWEHVRVSLKPDSDDRRFRALEFGPEVSGDLTIVAEFIALL